MPSNGPRVHAMLGDLARIALCAATFASGGDAQSPVLFGWVKGTCRDCRTAQWLDTIQVTAPEEAWVRGCRDSMLGRGAVFGQQPYCTVVHTADGGLTWTEVAGAETYPSGPGAAPFSFIDSRTGWMVRGDAADWGLIRTTDGGRNWKRMEWGPLGLHNLRFFDAQLGLAVEAAAKGNEILWRTTDGGLHWNKVQTPPMRYLGRLFFLDSRAGWMAGAHDKRVQVSTTTDGEHWSAPVVVVLPQTCRYPYVAYNRVADLVFQDRDRGWMTVELNSAVNGDAADKEWPEPGPACEGTRVLRTADGGKTWSHEPSLEGQGLVTIRFLPDGTAFAFAGAKPFYSRDGGRRWEPLPLPPPPGRKTAPEVHDCSAFAGDLFCTASDSYYLRDGGFRREFYLLRVHPRR
jgi:photosystem II stability/assembly factor-like uncharacterized protein